MSRSTEPRRARRRALGVLAAGALAIAGALLPAVPASAAPTWTITGTIGNWIPALDNNLQIYVTYDDGSGNETYVTDFTLTSGPSFASPDLPADPSGSAPASSSYTLYFDVLDDSLDYVDGYLGGKLDEEYPDVTVFSADSVADVVLGSVDVIEARYISGTVVGGGSALSGIDVYADDSAIAAASPTGYMMYPFIATTDVNGEYRLKVAAGRTYVVSVDDPDWLPQTYKLQNGCGCGVVPTLVSADPPPAPEASEIDFDLVDAATATQIVGIAADELSDPVDGLDVRLYRQNGASWALADRVTSNFTGLESFEFLLAAPGDVYRIQFVDSDGDVLRIADGVTTPDFSTFTPLDPVPACYAELGHVTDDLAVVALLDLDTAAGDCDLLGAAAPPGGGGGATPTRPRNPAVAASATANPTPTPTPTASPTPRPTADPTPSASPTPEPAPASAPDLWWLLWLLLGIVVVVVIGVAVLLVRRV